MESSEEKKRSVDEMLKREQGEEEEDVLAVSLGRETEGLEVCDAEDEEEQGSTPLTAACRKGMTEVSHVHVRV